MVNAEEWREIHDGFYEVSNLGKVRRAKPGYSTFVGRLLFPVAGGNGYEQVQLGGTSNRRAYVHHLVAEAFFGPRPTGYVVNHKDANKTNNVSYNLEYISARDNVLHAVKNVQRRKGPTKPGEIKPGRPRGEKHWTAKKPERIARGSNMPHCKLSSEMVQMARKRVQSGEKQKTIAIELGISVSQMSRIIRGTRWTYV